MKRKVKQATRTNLWFLALTWFAALWALVKLIVCWPKISWHGIREVIYMLLGMALILLTTAFFQSRLRSINRQQRLRWLIAARQQRAMVAFLLLEAGVIAFVTLISHAVAL